MADRITKAERTELRGVVRTQFKVLREEVAQRAAELHAAASDDIQGKYEEIDALRQQVEGEVREIAVRAEREMQAVIRANPDAKPQPSQRLIQYYPVQWQPDARYDLKGRAAVTIDQQMADAILLLKRQEADLLRDLAVDALETDAARAFLDGLPTAASLVPSVRLAALEQSLRDEPPDP